MADIERSAEAVWNGDLRGGKGSLNSGSGTLKNAPYSFVTRFEAPVTGTNPEELLASAHAACFSMAFANQLSKRGFTVEHVNTRAICHLTPQPTGGFKITKMVLETSGKVAGIDAATFASVAQETEKTGCPVSAALRSIEIEVKATLL